MTEADTCSSLTPTLHQKGLNLVLAVASRRLRMSSHFLRVISQIRSIVCVRHGRLIGRELSDYLGDGDKSWPPLRACHGRMRLLSRAAHIFPERFRSARRWKIDHDLHPPFPSSWPIHSLMCSVDHDSSRYGWVCRSKQHQVKQSFITKRRLEVYNSCTPKWRVFSSGALLPVVGRSILYRLMF